MENASYFQRVKIFILNGIRTESPFSLSIILLFTLFEASISLSESKGPSITDIIFIFGIHFALTLFVVIIGFTLISLVLALSKRKLPRTASGFLGILISLILSYIVSRYIFLPLFYPPNYNPFVDTHSGLDLQIVFLPVIIYIILLTHAAWKINDISLFGTNLSTKE